MLTTTNPTTTIDPGLRERILAEEAAAGNIVRLNTSVPSAEESLTEGYNVLVKVARGEAPATTIPAGVEKFGVGVEQLIKSHIPRIDKEPADFRPQKEGLTSGARCLLKARQKHPIKASVLEINEAQVARGADEVDVLHQTAAALRAVSGTCDGLVAPREDQLYRTLREGQDVLGPAIDRDPVMQKDFQEMTSYTRGRARRGAETRRANVFRSERERDKLKEEVGHEVRAEVVEELVRGVVKKMEPVTPAEDEGDAPTVAVPTLRAARTRRRPRRG